MPASVCPFNGRTFIGKFALHEREKVRGAETQRGRGSGVHKYPEERAEKWKEEVRREIGSLPKGAH